MTKAAIATTLALGALLIPTNAEATGHRAPMVDACRFQFLDHHPGWTSNEAAAEVQCAFLRFAPGQLVTACAIASRESGFVATAYNPSGASGLFQHLARYWPGRVLAYGRRAWFPRLWPNVSPFNARANAIPTARYVAANGWGAWG